MTKSPGEREGEGVQSVVDVPTAPMPTGAAPTGTMTAVSPTGTPPAMPDEGGASPHTGGAVDEPAHMPAAHEIPGGQPEDPAPSPGHVPEGDACSLRRGGEFALVYRLASTVIGRYGVIGTRGQWRTIEYPSAAAASRAYADEVQRLLGEGFQPLR